MDRDTPFILEERLARGVNAFKRLGRMKNIENINIIIFFVEMKVLGTYSWVPARFESSALSKTRHCGVRVPFDADRVKSTFVVPFHDVYRKGRRIHVILEPHGTTLSDALFRNSFFSGFLSCAGYYQ